MKIIKIFGFVFTLLVFILATSSCAVQKHPASSSKQPKAWFKNTNNPHHPVTTNPGHTKQKQHQKPIKKFKKAG
jgi:ABC-type oligopeptide transport system substrate-binding subunit